MSNFKLFHSVSMKNENAAYFMDAVAGETQPNWINLDNITYVSKVNEKKFKFLTDSDKGIAEENDFLVDGEYATIFYFEIDNRNFWFKLGYDAFSRHMEIIQNETKMARRTFV